MKPFKNILFTGSISAILFMTASGQNNDRTVADSTILADEDLLEQQSGDEIYPAATSVEKFPFSMLFRSRLIHREKPAIGYSDGYYTGSADKLYEYLRFKFANHIAGSLLLEKDAGEMFTNSFFTMNVVFQDICPLIKKIVFGDYRIESGLGLSLWSGRNYQKGADVISPVDRPGRGLVTSLTADEFHFFRGGGIDVSWQFMEMIVFYSSIKRSALLDKGGNVVSIDIDGYNRTKNELERRNNTGERVLGGKLITKLPFGLSLGVIAYRTKYSRKFAVEGRDNPSDKNLYALDISYNLRRIALFGELVKKSELVSGSMALLLYPKKNISLIISYRYYPQNSATQFAYPFGEWGSGERGFYFGFKIKPWSFVAISSYYDQFESLKESRFPVFGNDVLFDCKISLPAKTVIGIQYRSKRTEFSYLGDLRKLTGGITGNNLRRKHRVSIEQHISQILSLRGRYELNVFHDGVELKTARGFMVFQDITLRIPKNFLFSVRVTYFRSSSGESAAYQLERDMEGVLTQVQLNGEGIRFYLLAEYHLSQFLKISCKYSVLARDDVLYLGSGHDRIQGNRDSRISVQVDIAVP